MQTNGVATNRAIDVQFSTDMDASTINQKTFLLAEASDGSTVPGSVSYDATNRVGSFKPSAALSPLTKYNATITTGAADASGNHLANAFTFSFSTRDSGDTSPIGVYRTTPANGQIGVDVNTKIQVVFTEGAESDSVTIASFAVEDSNGAPVEGAVTYDIYSNVATFYPSAPLAAGMKYTVTIDGVRDLAGVPMTAPYIFTFTTGGAAGGGSQQQDLVYEDDQLNDTINGWIFDAASGTLTQASGSPAFTDQGPHQLLVSPNGNFLYAVMAQEQPTVRGSICTNAPTEVIVYSIDHTSGALTLVQRINLNGYCGGDNAAIDPEGKFMYVGETTNNLSSGMIDVLSLDATTGKMSLVSGSPFASTQSPDLPGQMVVAGNYLYAADRNFGTMTGILIYKRDPNTGAVQSQPGSTVAPQTLVAALPSGTSLYSVDMNSGTVTEFSIDQTTGSLTKQGTIGSGQNAFEIEIDPGGQYAAVIAQEGVHLYSIGKTGQLSELSGSPFGDQGVSVMFDSSGSYFATIQYPGGLSEVGIYSLSNGSVKPVAGTVVDNDLYPVRITMLSK